MWQLMRAGVLFLLTLFSATAAVVATARLIYRDPFAPYLAVMPGQPIDALEDLPCQVYASNSTNMQVGICNFAPDGGSADQVTIVAYGSLITRTYLAVQPGRLYVGDLAACWGKPNYSIGIYLAPRTSLDLYWDDQLRAEAFLGQSGAPPTYFLPIIYVLMDDSWMPCGS